MEKSVQMVNYLSKKMTEILCKKIQSGTENIKIREQYRCPNTHNCTPMSGCNGSNWSETNT